MNEETKVKANQISEMVSIYSEQMFKAGAENFDLIKMDLENKKIQLQEIAGQLKSDLNKLYDDGANEIDPEVNSLQIEIQKVESTIDDVNQLLSASIDNIEQVGNLDLMEEIEKLEPETETEHDVSDSVIEDIDEKIEKIDNLEKEENDFKLNDDSLYQGLSESIEELPDEDGDNIDSFDDEETQMTEDIEMAEEFSEELNNIGDNFIGKDESDLQEDSEEVDEFDEIGDDEDEQYEEVNEYDIEIPAAPEVSEYEPSEDDVEQEYQYVDTEVQPTDDDKETIDEPADRETQEDEEVFEKNDENDLEINNESSEKYEQNDLDNSEVVEEYQTREVVIEQPKKRIEFRIPTSEMVTLAEKVVNERFSENMHAIAQGFKIKNQNIRELADALSSFLGENTKVEEKNQNLNVRNDKTLEDRIR